MQSGTLLSIITAVMAVLGGVVSAHAPTKSKHKWMYGVGFFILGLASVALIFQTQKKDQAEQDALRSKLDASVQQEKYVQGQLDSMKTILGVVAANSDPKQTALLFKGLGVGQEHSTLKKRTLKLASDIEAFDNERGKGFPPSTPEMTQEERAKATTAQNAYNLDTLNLFRNRFSDRSIGIIQEFKAKGIISSQLEPVVVWGTESQAMPTHLRALANRIDDAGNVKQ